MIKILSLTVLTVFATSSFAAEVCRIQPGGGFGSDISCTDSQIVKVLTNNGLYQKGRGNIKENYISVVKILVERGYTPVSDKLFIQY